MTPYYADYNNQYNYVIVNLRVLFAIAFTVEKARIDSKNFGSIIVDEVASIIYDTDTFRVNIKFWPAIIGERIAIRVNGIDVPEIRGKCLKGYYTCDAAG